MRARVCLPMHTHTHTSETKDTYPLHVTSISVQAKLHILPMIPQLERQHPLATARGSWPHWTLRSATGNTLSPNSEPEFRICNHCHPLFHLRIRK
ncbi:hypothetical protein FQN60_004548 [Etheostoma spectabile]|uniref:Uncharacterized protein n=1 Tax=Etheostoma spectabile TaxID=54343 RepID=A0A5J5DK47_9PERO|nr:hypothetical protein FQN60_004548 [Etheostoma spectabile]